MRVHERIRKRHPELSDSDVVYAWEHYTTAAVREAGAQEVRTGFDLHGRELEMIAVITDGEWLVYHAFSPPTKKFRQEIERRRRRI